MRLQNSLQQQMDRLGLKTPHRRGSHGMPILRGLEMSESHRTVLTLQTDELGTGTDGRRFLIHVDQTLEGLQAQEDTHDHFQITIEDKGPKVSSPHIAHSPHDGSP